MTFFMKWIFLVSLAVASFGNEESNGNQDSVLMVEMKNSNNKMRADDRMSKHDVRSEKVAKIKNKTKSLKTFTDRDENPKTSHFYNLGGFVKQYNSWPYVEFKRGKRKLDKHYINKRQVVYPPQSEAYASSNLQYAAALATANRYDYNTGTTEGYPYGSIQPYNS